MCRHFSKTQCIFSLIVNEFSWVTHGNSQYILVTYQYNRDAAQQYCKNNKAHLVNIESEEENTYVYSMFKNGLSTSDDLWIGINDINTEGSYQKSDGTAQNYFNWRDGEPNNDHGGQPENCVDMSYTSSKWNDRSCSTKLSFICERGRMISLISYLHIFIIFSLNLSYHICSTFSRKQMIRLG